MYEEYKTCIQDWLQPCTEQQRLFNNVLTCRHHKIGQKDSIQTELQAVTTSIAGNLEQAIKGTRNPVRNRIPYFFEALPLVPLLVAFFFILVAAATLDPPAVRCRFAFAGAPSLLRSDSEIWPEYHQCWLSSHVTTYSFLRRIHRFHCQGNSAWAQSRFWLLIDHR